MNKLSLLTLFLLLLQFAQVSAQNAIMERVQQKITNIEKTTVYQPLEEVKGKADLPLISKSVLSEKQFFQLNSQAVKNITENKSEYLQMTLPIEGKDTKLQLVEANIFSDDFRAVAVSNPGVELNIDRGQHYWGIVKGAEKSLVVISFFENTVLGVISLKNRQYSLGKYENTDYHILYKDNNLKYNPDFSCEYLEDDENKEMIVNNGSAEKAADDYCVKIHMEADYSLYEDLGGINSTTNYVNGVFAQVAALFANDGVTVQISYLNIWDEPSPYEGTPSEILSILRAQGYGQTYGNLTHLLHRLGGGGIAGISSACNFTNNNGISGVFGFFNDIPTYSWDVYVITHELGHNLGSRHTHDCVWNGNNTAIDGCGPEAGFPTGCPTASVPSTGGTIMSYCHLNSVGINFNEGFGDQPAELIRDRINNTFDCLELCNDGSQSAYPDGNPHDIPGTINATNYDNGGEGVAYNDTSNGNEGSGTRQGEDVDTENRASGGNVGWIANGEWLEYTVDVQSSGSYTVSFNVASKNSNGQLKVEFDGDNVSGNVNIPSTGNWGNFTNVTKNVSLNSGEQVMRITFTKGGFNLGNISFSSGNNGDDNDDNDDDDNDDNDDNDGNSDIVVMRKRNAMGYAIDGNRNGANGQSVYLYDYDPGNINQQWVEIDRGGGFYSYQKNGTNYCLDGGNGGANGQDLYLWNCSAGEYNQHWQKISMGGGAYRLKKRNASYSIDGNNGGGRRQNVYIWSSSNSEWNQQWVFEVVGQARMEQEQDVDLYVYPNPFNDELTVELPLEVESTTMTVQLVDITGKVVYEKNQLVTGQVLQINQELPNGFYFLKWSDEQNQMFATRKVIKQ